MKKNMLFSVLIISVLVWALPASSLTVQSDFGFQITLPANWTVVSRNDVKDKPDVVKGTFEVAEKEKTLLDLPKDLYNMLKEKMVGGQVEYYYRTDTPHFSISVYEEKGTLSQSEDGVKETCQLLPQELSKVSQKPVKVHECRLKEVGNTKGLFVVADTYHQGEKYAQYMIQKDPDKVLLFTATGKEQDFNAMSSEFEKVMKSLEVK